MWYLMAERQSSLYWWFKKDPKNNFRHLYPKPGTVIPDIIRSHAAVWHQWFVSEGKHPGDGVMWFHDFLLAPSLKDIFPRLIEDDCTLTYPSKYADYAKLFNYLWSFSAGNPSVKGALSERAGMVLTIVLLKSPGLSVPLYECRREIDFKAFSKYVSLVLSKRRSSTVRDIAYNELVISDVEKYLWQTILRLPLEDLWQKKFRKLLILWAAYTPEAVRRFVKLHTGSRRELRTYIDTAASVFMETRSLIQDRSLLFVEPGLLPKASSIAMMLRFHDAEHERQLMSQMGLQSLNWVWPQELTDSLSKFPEWYVPSRAAEIILRGKQHGNCVGAYVGRHFAPPDKHLKPKCLLLFTDYYEAELQITFGTGKDGTLKSISADVYQAKGRFNIDAPSAAIRSLLEAKKMLVGLPVTAFAASRVE